MIIHRLIGRALLWFIQPELDRRAQQKMEAQFRSGFLQKVLERARSDLALLRDDSAPPPAQGVSGL